MKGVEAIEIVSDLASQQWGLITAAQSKSHGVDQPSLRRLANRGVLVRIRHGVYAFSATPQSSELEVKAHWLALRPETMAVDRIADEDPDGLAVVSHGTAAELWEIGDLWPDGVHFTIGGRRQSRQADVRFHRAGIQRADWTILRGLPVTTIARTIADLAAQGHEKQHLQVLIDDAVRRGLVTEDEVLNQLPS